MEPHEISPQPRDQSIRDRPTQVARALNYELQSVLGRGLSGTVYRAVHVPTKIEVAIKHLHKFEPEGMTRMKREFHLLCEIDHPNLAHMYELVVQGDDCFFAMELVDGPALLSWVRHALPDGVVNKSVVDRTSGALGQLCAALIAVHAAKRVHRDIKPANVQVCDNVVKLLDFDLAVVAQNRAYNVAGTLPYMAPETLWNDEPTASADIYSLGVLAYECLSGRSPFLCNNPIESDALKRAGIPALPDGVPKWLVELVDRMTSVDPALRPNADEILIGIQSRIQIDAPTTLKPPPMIGRERFLGTLSKIFEDKASGPTLVRVSGSSGIGKTHFIRNFCDRVLKSEDSHVLRTRCLPIATVPLQGIDGVVDCIIQLMRELTVKERLLCIPPDIGDLFQLFSAFSQLEEFDRAASNSLVTPDVRDRRSLGFDALRSVLRSMANLRNLLIWIDDVQWSDRDSIDFWVQTLQHPHPLFVITSAREAKSHFDVDPHPVSGCTARNIDMNLTPLDGPEVHELLRSTFVEGLSESDEALIAKECRGNPFLALQLAEHHRNCEPDSNQAPSLASVLRHRLEDVNPSTALLLELCCVATVPMGLDSLATAVDIDSPGSAAQELLGMSRLIERVPLAPTMPIIPYHDGIREAVVSELDESTLRAHHRSLATMLSKNGAADPVAAFWHWHGASDANMVLRHAVIAGDHLMNAMAFDQAIQVFRVGVEHSLSTKQEAQLLEKLGFAYEASGMGRSAGEAYEDAAHCLAGIQGGRARARDLQRRSAEALLRSGFISLGFSKLKTLLPSKSMPRTTFALVVFAAKQRLMSIASRVFGRKTRPSADQLERLNTLWAATVGTVWSDIALSAYYQSLHSRLASAMGNALHSIRATATEACYLASISPTFFRRQIENRQRESLQLAKKAGDSNLLAMVYTTSAATTFLSGRWRETVSLCETAIDIIKRDIAGAEWELTNAYIYSVWSQAVLGRFDEASSLRQNAIQHAKTRDNLLTSAYVRVGLPNLTFLAEGNSDKARAMSSSALSKWESPSIFSLLEFHALFGDIQTDLFDGNAFEARKRFEEANIAIRKSLLLHIQMNRTTFHYLNGITALAASSMSRDQTTQQQLLSIANKASRRLIREKVPWCKALGHALRASVCLQKHSTHDAQSQLLVAERMFRESDTFIFGAAVSHHLNTLGQQRSSPFNFEVENPIAFAQCILPFAYDKYFAR